MKGPSAEWRRDILAIVFQFQDHTSWLYKSEKHLVIQDNDSELNNRNVSKVEGIFYKNLYHRMSIGQMPMLISVVVEPTRRFFKSLSSTNNMSLSWISVSAYNRYCVITLQSIIAQFDKYMKRGGLVLGFSPTLLQRLVWKAFQSIRMIVSLLHSDLKMARWVFCSKSSL